MKDTEEDPVLLVYWCSKKRGQKVLKKNGELAAWMGLFRTADATNREPKLRAMLLVSVVGRNRLIEVYFRRFK